MVHVDFEVPVGYWRDGRCLADHADNSVGSGDRPPTPVSVVLDLTFLPACVRVIGASSRDASRTRLARIPAQENWLLLDACLELKREF